MKKRNYSITGHMVVRNEDIWIWYAIMSVIDYLDKIIIYDTGSIDKTNDIIECIKKNEKYKEKIIYKEWGFVSPEKFHKVRQEQIDITDSDYFMVIDGDEIWYEDSLKELDEILSSDRPDLVATRFINVCGDIFHYRYDSRETYCINGIKGAITIRVYSMNIPKISCGGIYGVEGYIDESRKPVQEGGYSTIVQNGKYLHTSLLTRSTSQIGDFSIKYRQNKLKAKWDARFEDDFKYPEVFNYKLRPQIVRSPYEREFNLIRFIYHFALKMKGCFLK